MPNPKIPIFIFLFLSSLLVFSQSKFVINGNTNTLTDGKAILYREPKEFYALKKANDTVLVRNHSFIFTGVLKYPEGYRIKTIDKKNNSNITEPFFISAGSHKLTIDKASNPHDYFQVGYGVDLQNDAANDEYTKNYLPLYKDLIERYNSYEQSMAQCRAIKDAEKKKACTLAAGAERSIIGKGFEDVLITYAKVHPGSPILPWLIWDEIRLNGYRESYQSVFNSISKNTPDHINALLSNLLAKQKLRTPGFPFPLTDFVKANITINNSQNRYLLIDFWFSSCVPCITQFKDLKEVYGKYGGKGFDVIAVSVDKKEAIPAYQKLIKENGYLWQQVLDTNGVKTKSINVNSFPSSFLLDSNWKIIKANTNPEFLKRYLEEHLEK